MRPRLSNLHKTADLPARSLAEAATLDFTIIVVNYNVREFLRQALRSVYRAVDSLSAEIFVVDNASEDGSVDMARAEFPDVHLIENAENRGFAAANNQVLSLARGQFIVLLNPDTVVQEDTFLAVRRFFTSPEGREAGMVGCKILNPDGTLQLACRRSFPTPWVAFTRLSGLSRLFPRSRVFGKYNLTYLDEDEVAEVEAISGSFMVIRREALRQVGLLDEMFFLYGEDLDWCLRLRAVGWKIYYVPQTQIIHFKGESSKRSQLDNLRVFYQAMHLFARKHFRARLSRFFYWLLLVAIWIRGGLSVLRKAIVAVAIPLVDLFLLQAALAAGILMRFGNFQHAQSFLIVDAVYSPVWMACLGFFGCFGRQRFSPYQALMAAATGFFINASFTYFFNQYAFSRGVLLAAGTLTMVSLSGWRLVARILYWLGIAPFHRALGATELRRRTVVVGDFAAGESILPKLVGRADTPYEIIGLVGIQPREVGCEYHGVPVLATLEGLEQLIRRRRIQEVIFSVHSLPFDLVLGVMAKTRDLGATFKLTSGNVDVIIGKASIDQLQDVPLVDVEYRLQYPFFKFSKRAFDFVLAILLIMVLLLPFALRWMLTGRQIERRRGYVGARALHLWSLHRAGHEPTRLDRLPWLWPVLTGALSMVGSELSFDAGRSLHYGGLPVGLTGLVQLKKQPHLPGAEREKLHLFYATHYSPLLDLEILFRTLFHL